MRIKKYRNDKEVVNTIVTETNAMANIINCLENGTTYNTDYDTFIFTWKEDNDNCKLVIEPSEE